MEKKEITPRNDLPVRTKDGSITYNSVKYGETYHSVSGAKEEAEKKYAESCEISKYQQVNILDVCFGLGYNSAAAIDNFKGDEIHIVGLENYDGIINEIIKRTDYPFKCKEFIQQAAKKKYVNSKINGFLCELKIIMDDARDSIKVLDTNTFDIVFFDPFSPKRCPWMWTEKFFRDIHKVMKKNGVLATYSCARTVRTNLKNAGFRIEDGPTIGRRGPGTIARKH